MWKCFTIRIITSIKLNYVWIDLCMFVAGRVICLLFLCKNCLLYDEKLLSNKENGVRICKIFK